MGRKNKPSRRRQSERRVYIRGDKRDQIDRRKLCKALLALAAAEAETAARREHAERDQLEGERVDESGGSEDA